MVAVDLGGAVFPDSSLIKGRVSVSFPLAFCCLALFAVATVAGYTGARLDQYSRHIGHAATGRNTVSFLSMCCRDHPPGLGGCSDVGRIMSFYPVFGITYSSTFIFKNRVLTDCVESPLDTARSIGHKTRTMDELRPLQCCGQDVGCHENICIFCRVIGRSCWFLWSGRLCYSWRAPVRRFFRPEMENPATIARLLSFWQSARPVLHAVFQIVVFFWQFTFSVWRRAGASIRGGSGSRSQGGSQFMSALVSVRHFKTDR